MLRQVDELCKQSFICICAPRLRIRTSCLNLLWAGNACIHHHAQASLTRSDKTEENKDTEASQAVSWYK